MKNRLLKSQKTFLQFCFGTLLLASCSEQPAAEQQSAADSSDVFLSKEQFEAGNMKIGHPTKATFNKGFSIGGMVAVPPEYRAEVSTFFPGYIRSIPLIEGEEVRKGEVLFTIENPNFLDIQKDFLAAREEMAYLQADYERQKELWEDSIASKKVYLRARASYQSTLSQKEALAGKLRLMGINPAKFNESKMRSSIAVQAPFAGYITSIQVSTGTYVSPQQIALRMISTEHLHAEFTIYESDVSRVYKGQQVHFKPLNASTDSLYRGEVFAVKRSIDSQYKSTNMHVHIHPEGSNPGLTVGTYLEGKVITQALEALALPQMAVSKEADKYFALKLVRSNAKGYYFNKVRLLSPLTNENFVGISDTGSFKSSDQFLLQGAYSLM